MKKSILFSLLFGMSVIAFAQGDPGGNPDEDVPLDGGIAFVAVAGAMYGARKLKEARNRKQKDSSLSRP
ncbi:MAG: hypothetical protein K0R82_857 [Flavipsychrobacter sp.]|jgi:hypothetical protein|nr:hypothetical protein [Flavipsychrobacter sp.]